MPDDLGFVAAHCSSEVDIREYFSPSFQLPRMASSRKCWECRRRRRVCNAKLPCHQCEKDGITCSGYGSKPVTFLPIGMRSRHRRGEEDDAIDSGRPTDRPTVRSSIVAHASVPRDLVRQQDVYFVNAANFCKL